MPIVKVSSYPKPLFYGKHIETILPAIARKPKIESCIQKKIKTRDNDFLDLDHYQTESHHAVIISHGMEGNSRRSYVLGMANYLVKNGFDVVAWNMRGCSGVLNKKVIYYHSGFTQDLDDVIKWCLQKGYKSISLIGFSLGGNLTLKYLGEQESIQSIHSSVVFSVPLDLSACSDEIDKIKNCLYRFRFLRSLKQKALIKAPLFPDQIDSDKIKKTKSIRSFDDVFTAPLNGYDNAEDYYQKCSSINFLDKIKVKTLLINALNDPLLHKNCFPYEVARAIKAFVARSDKARWSLWVFCKIPKRCILVGKTSFRIH